MNEREALDTARHLIEKREIEERVLDLARPVCQYIDYNGTGGWPKGMREYHQRFHDAVVEYEEKVLGLTDDGEEDDEPSR